MKPGDWVIDGWIVPFPITAEYTKTTINLFCLAIGTDTKDPREEIKEISQKIPLGYSNEYVLPKGTATMGSGWNRTIDFTDGSKQYRGLVVNITFDEDSRSNKYIFYNIHLVIYRETEALTNIISGLPDGDEVTFDDDWEKGWETYTPPQKDDGTGTTGGTSTLICPDPTPWKSGRTIFTAGNNYSNLTLHQKTSIYGAKRTQYGWLVPPMYRNFFFDNNEKYVVVIRMASNVNAAFFCFSYPYYDAAAITGRFGQRSDVPFNLPHSQIPDKFIRCNNEVVRVSFGSRTKKTHLFRFGSRRDVVFTIPTDTRGRILIHQVIVGVV